MTNFVKTTMLAAVALIGTGVASAQTQLKAEIPFAFRAGNKTMQPGTYLIGQASGLGGNRLIRFLNSNLRESAIFLPQAPHDVDKAWRADGRARLAFTCGSDHCDLSGLWVGDPSAPAYRFAAPRSRDESVHVAIIMAQPVKAE